MCDSSLWSIVGFAVLASVVSAPVAGRAYSETATSKVVSQPIVSNRDLPRVVAVKPPPSEPLLQIENLRLESAPPKAPQPSVLLKFDILNDTSLRLTDVVMRVSFLEKRADDVDAPRRVIVGPVTVRVGETVRAGYVLSYEMLFRNLSSDCDCAPRVEILSARQLPD